MAVPPAPVRVPSQRPLAPNQSRWSLMIRVIMKWSWGLCTDLLEFALQLRKTPENLSFKSLGWRGCATSHRLKWGPFPPNKVGKMAQHVRKGDGRKEGKDGVGSKLRSEEEKNYFQWRLFPYTYFSSADLDNDNRLPISLNYSLLETVVWNCGLFGTAMGKENGHVIWDMYHKQRFMETILRVEAGSDSTWINLMWTDFGRQKAWAEEPIWWITPTEHGTSHYMSNGWENSSLQLSHSRQMDFLCCCRKLFFLQLCGDKNLLWPLWNSCLCSVPTLFSSRVLSKNFKIKICKIIDRFKPVKSIKLIYLYFPPSSQLLYLCFCPVGLSLL